MSPSEKKAERKDTKVGRFYAVDDRALPSVTEILRCVGKPALIQWAAKEERTLAMETAADLYFDAHGTPKMSRPTYLATLDARIGKLRANQRLLQKAGEIGAQVHALIEWNLCPAAKQARQTHCLRGHPFDAENTYKNSRGQRFCKTCRRATDRRRNQTTERKSAQRTYCRNWKQRNKVHANV